MRSSRVRTPKGGIAGTLSAGERGASRYDGRLEVSNGLRRRLRDETGNVAGVVLDPTE